MKRAIFGLITFALFVSCGHNTHSALVEKEFRNYVQMNFDDPKNLEEIISISACDTVSIEKMRTLCSITMDGVRHTVALCSKRDSLVDIEMKNMHESLPKQYRGSYANALHGKMWASNLSSIIQRKRSISMMIFYYMNRMQSLMDSVKYRPAIYCYKIDYRNKTREGLKLETAYAYIDSLSHFVVVHPTKNDEAVMSEDYKEVFRNSKKTFEHVMLLEQTQSEYEQKFVGYKEFVRLLYK